MPASLGNLYGHLDFQFRCHYITERSFIHLAHIPQGSMIYHCFSLIQLLLWTSCWFWRYKVKQIPYSREDASYLTQTSLRVPVDAWKNIGEQLIVAMLFFLQSNLMRLCICPIICS